MDDEHQVELDGTTVDLENKSLRDPLLGKARMLEIENSPVMM